MIKLKNNRGFTLMEILVVMAISSILMMLVLGPVVQSFQLTRQAQAMVEAQDSARTALHMISRELGQAMFVFDNAQGPITVNDMTDVPSPPSACQTPIMLPVAQPDGSTQWFVLPSAKIDFILPKLYMHCNNPGHTGGPRDYPRDIEVTEGGYTRTELYGWPDCPYCKAAHLVADDVEARPKVPLEQSVTIVRYFLGLRHNDLGEFLVPGEPSTANAGWVSPWGKNVIEGTENAVVLYRAEFNPYDNNLFPASMSISERLSDPFFFYRSSPGENSAFYYESWMRIAKPVGIAKYEDLVTAIHKKDASGNDLIASVEPTITFHTASVENDTFNPAYLTDTKNDYPTAPPTVFSGTYGYWTPESRVDVMRGDYCDDPPGGVDYYTTFSTTSPTTGDLVVMRRVWDAAHNAWNETIEFNISLYNETGYVPPDSAALTPPLEMAFTIDANRGAVSFALQPPRPKDTTSGTNATSGPVCVFDAGAVNSKFKVDYATDRGGAIRYVILPTFDNAKANQYLKNARVVPGSEKVIGPDMTFGGHFGLPVRYERVPLALGDPGMNQYKIDYDTGWLFFSRDPSLDLPEDRPDPTDPTIPPRRIPTDPIRVYYLIYFNQLDDVVRGDYLTKSLINVHIGMRMYDPDSGKAHPVDLSDSVKIRNAIR